MDGIEAQTKMCMEKIKSRLEECGSSLENIIKLTYYIKGPVFPEGIPGYRRFFQGALPGFMSDKNPPTSDLIGVSGLGHKNMLIEIACVAALPDD